MILQNIKNSEDFFDLIQEEINIEFINKRNIVLSSFYNCINNEGFDRIKELENIRVYKMSEKIAIDVVKSVIKKIKE